MNVCFVIPPSDFLLDERVFPSLGVLKVAAVARKSHDVQVLDLSGEQTFSLPEADVYAITATTPQYPWAVRIAKEARRLGKKVILGGPHVTLSYAGRDPRPRQSLEAHFDGLVRGDGELAFEQALAGGVVNADANNSLFMTGRDFDESDFPARDLIDLDSYHYEIDGRRATSIIGQLGCPFNCGFCGGRNSRSLRVTRNRSSERIVQEIDSIVKTYGYTGFMFYDDELNVSKGLPDLLRQIIEYRTDLRFRGFVKAELFTEEQAELMYEAGFRWLLCGFESAHPRILQNIQKRATVEDNTRMLEIARKYGLKVKALMSMGHPGESRETVQATGNWLVENQVDDFDLTVITPYPGTPYQDEAVGGTYEINGDRLHMEQVNFENAAQYYKGVPGEYVSYVSTDYLSRGDIVKMRDDVDRLARELLGIPSLEVQFEHSMGQ